MTETDKGQPLTKEQLRSLIGQVESRQDAIRQEGILSHCQEFKYLDRLAFFKLGLQVAAGVKFPEIYLDTPSNYKRAYRFKLEAPERNDGPHFFDGVEY